MTRGSTKRNRTRELAEAVKDVCAQLGVRVLYQEQCGEGEI